MEPIKFGEFEPVDQAQNYREMYYSHYLNEHLVDTEIVTSNGTLKVHKNIVSDANQVFKNLLAELNTDKSEKISLALPQFRIEVMRYIIEYLYRGKCQYFREIDRDIIKAKKFFELADYTELENDSQDSVILIKNDVPLVVISDDDELPQSPMRNTQHSQRPPIEKSMVIEVQLKEKPPDPILTFWMGSSNRKCQTKTNEKSVAEREQSPEPVNPLHTLHPHSRLKGKTVVRDELSPELSPVLSCHRPRPPNRKKEKAVSNHALSPEPANSCQTSHPEGQRKEKVVSRHEPSPEPVNSYQTTHPEGQRKEKAVAERKRLPEPVNPWITSHPREEKSVAERERSPEPVNPWITSHPKRPRKEKAAAKRKRSSEQDNVSRVNRKKDNSWLPLSRMNDAAVAKPKQSSGSSDGNLINKLSETPGPSCSSAATVTATAKKPLLPPVHRYVTFSNKHQKSESSNAFGEKQTLITEREKGMKNVEKAAVEVVYVSSDSSDGNMTEVIAFNKRQSSKKANRPLKKDKKPAVPEEHDSDSSDGTMSAVIAFNKRPNLTAEERKKIWHEKREKRLKEIREQIASYPLKIRMDIYYKCMYCSNKFQELKIHVKAVHRRILRKRQFICMACKAEFFFQQAFNVHKEYCPGHPPENQLPFSLQIRPIRRRRKK